MTDKKSEKKLNAIMGCEKSTRVADVIFVHGLDGGAFSTWQRGQMTDTFWPKWLGEDIDSVGVWSLGYRVSSTSSKGTAMSLVDRATNVLDQLSLDEIGMRPIIFICHSYGGLLVKQMLKNASDSSNSEFRRIATNTRGILFFSTPHSGSSVATWANYFRPIIGTTVAIEELTAGNPTLLDLNNWFRDYPDLSNISIFVYCERIKTSGMMVVDAVSANPGIRGVTPVPVDCNHETICTPEDRSSIIYKRTKKFVEGIAVNPTAPRRS